MQEQNMTESATIENAIAAGLLHIKAVKLSPDEPFTWASGMLSPIYCDNRVALSFPEFRNQIIQALVEKSAAFRAFDAVAGVATAGIAHGAYLADRLGLPFAYVRSGAKDHGRKNQIEGELPAGARVLVVEDLISTGGSCIKAVDALRDAGMAVCGVLAIFQYGFTKADMAFEAAGVPFATLTHYDILVQQAVQKGYIQPEQLDTLRKWRENPEAWGALYV
jgi:orotate phosphoribosyltransferase